MGLHFGEIILIIAVIALVFGATRIPKIARSLGEGLREFKKALKDPEASEKEPPQPAGAAAAKNKKPPQA